MSYDPYYDADQPRPGDPDEDFGRPLPERGDRLKGRVQAPGIALIVIGVLNIFYVLYMVVNGVMWATAPDYLMKSAQDTFPGLQGGMDRNQQMTVGIIESFTLATFGLVATVLPIAAGVRMLSMKSYALAICGAVVAMIPCVSGTACCGLGEGAGIWALIVLLNPDVKSVFR